MDNMNSMEIENMDNLIREYVPKTPTRNKCELAMQWPFRCLIAGASSRGKTNLVLNIIMKQLIFDKLYLYFKDESEDKYEFLISYFTALEKKYNDENGTDEKIIEWSTNPNDIVAYDDLDKEKQNLIVMDDMVLDKNQEKNVKLFTMGRKRNASTIYQTQNLFATPQNIRKNCDYIILFSTNKREINELAKSYATDIPYDEFVRIYKDAVSEPYSWFLIDANAKHVSFKYRCKFDGLYKPPERDTE